MYCVILRKDCTILDGELRQVSRDLICHAMNLVVSSAQTATDCCMSLNLSKTDS